LEANLFDEDIIEELRQSFHIEDEVQFNEFNLMEKLQMNGSLLLKYKNLYNEAKIRLDNMMNVRDRIVGSRYDFYKFESDKNLSKTEIEKYYLPKDEKILESDKLMKAQEIRVMFFEMCVKVLEKTSYNMKTFSDNLRSGVV
jgi:hypothetical protein